MPQIRNSAHWLTDSLTRVKSRDASASKKKVSQLQPNHGTQQNFFYAVENNVQDASVRGAAKTAGKVMVYGQGPLFQQFLAAGIKHDKTVHYVCQNDFDFAEHQFSDAD